LSLPLFQDFFELRSDEWEVYLKETDARQGDLSDPKYFDFISAAQLATITREMRTGRLIFEELTGAEGTKEVVSRGPSSPQNNDLLPWALYNRAGETIYAGSSFSFPACISLSPLPLSPSARLSMHSSVRLSISFPLSRAICLCNLGPDNTFAYQGCLQTLPGKIPSSSPRSLLMGGAPRG